MTSDLKPCPCGMMKCIHNLPPCADEEPAPAVDPMSDPRVMALVRASKFAMEWMEQLRVCGDCGFWEWREGDEYSELSAALAALDTP